MQLRWAPGTEPWRALGIPVNEEPDLRPEMIKRVTDCQKNYYKKFNVVRLRSACCLTASHILRSECCNPTTGQAAGVVINQDNSYRAGEDAACLLLCSVT